MKAAVIDMGTNTFHLIIAELSATGVEVLYKTNLPVQLGQGRINENIIIPEAFERGIKALKGFREEIDLQKVEVVRATATSAVRSAANGQDFVDAAAKRAGIKIEVISGDDEAAFIFNAVKATGLIKQTSLIMDIGGGSTEFILCDEEELIWKKSYNIGAARLMQGYFKSDPINDKDQETIISHLDEELKALKVICEEFGPTTLIGSAGAFETFAVMLDKEINLKNNSTANIPIANYKQLAHQLIKANHNERANMEGLIPLRVDMIVMASILTNYILDQLTTIKDIKLSTYDLKMGVLQRLKGQI